MADIKFQRNDAGQVFWTNLLALGFESKVAESKHRIEFNKDMFLKPNLKGFEVVMHFLFHKLNPQQAKEKFRDCYPVQDKTQETLFRKTCRDWIQNIAQKLALISLQQGIVHIPKKGGRKFCSFLRDFSTFVLCENVKLEAADNQFLFPFPSTSSSQEIRQWSRTPSYKLYNLGTALVLNSLLETRNRLQNYYTELEDIGINLTRQYRQYLQQVALHKKLLHSAAEELGIYTTSELLKEEDSCAEFDSVMTNVCIQKSEIENKWTFSEESFGKAELAWKIFDDVLFKERQITSLHKDSLAINLSDGIFANSDFQLEKNNKLSLVGLFSAWNVILCQIRRNGQLENFQRVAGDQLKISQVQLQLESLQSLKSKLDNDVIPSWKSFSKFLRGHLMETGVRSPSVMELGRELMCPTPPLTRFHFEILENTPSPYLSLRSVTSNQSGSTISRHGQSKKRAQLSRNRLIATTDRRQAQKILTEEQSFASSITFPEHEFGCGDTKKCDSFLLHMKRSSLNDSYDGFVARQFDDKESTANKDTPSPNVRCGKKFNAAEELGLHVLDTPVRTVSHFSDNGSFSSPSRVFKYSPHSVSSTYSTPHTAIDLISPDMNWQPTPPLLPRLQKLIQAQNSVIVVPSDSDPEPLETLQISLVESTPSPQTPPYPPRLWKFLQAETDKVADI